MTERLTPEQLAEIRVEFERLSLFNDTPGDYIWLLASKLLAEIESLMAERNQYQQALNAIIKAVNAGEMDRVEAIVAGAALNATEGEKPQ